jgi:hypothetical protein
VEEIKPSLSASVYCTDLYFFTCCRPYTVRFLSEFNGTINLTPPTIGAVVGILYLSVVEGLIWFRIWTSAGRTIKRVVSRKCIEFLV